MSAISIDFGGVIIDRWEETELWSSKDFVEVPPIQGGFTGIRRLNDLFERRVYINSAAKAITQRKTWAWLDHHRFYKHTGITAGQVYMVPEREDKIAVVKKLGITHHIDDRPELIHMLSPYVLNLYLFCGVIEELELYPDLGDITNWQSWPEMVQNIEQDFC